MTVQSSIIMRLLDLVPDAALREQIRDQYYHDMEAQTSFVQVRMGQLELDLKDQVQQSLGATNEMIGESVILAKEGGVALRELRDDFRSWITTVTALSDGLLDTQRKVADHDREIASFRQSRDLSVAERRQFQTDLAESKADLQSIHDELHAAQTERQAMRLQLEEILALLSGRPSNDEAQRLIETIHETVRRVDELERRDRLSREK